VIRFFILVVYSVLICLLYSIAIGQPQPKIGVTPVEFYFEEKPIWHEDIREPWHFIEIAKDIFTTWRGAFIIISLPEG
jgi:hypothetical protein